MNSTTPLKPLLSGVLCFGLYAGQSATAADSPQYRSLEEFCLASQVDTPENCKCGQARANEIMTPEEQAIALGMMTGDMNAFEKLGARAGDFLRKLEDVTSGCQ